MVTLLTVKSACYVTESARKCYRIAVLVLV